MSESELFTSVWQMLDSAVLVAVRVEGDVEAPAVVPTPHGPCVPAWLDRERAAAMLPPGFVLRQTLMDVLVRTSTLRAETGIIIEPGSATSVVVPGAERLALIPMTVPFPPGAETSWGDLPEGALPLLRALTSKAPAVEGLQRMWLARFQVEDAREQVAVVYEVDDQRPAADVEAVDALQAAIAALDPAYPVRTLALTDLPDGPRQWLEDSVPPAWADQQA